MFASLSCMKQILWVGAVWTDKFISQPFIFPFPSAIDLELKIDFSPILISFRTIRSTASTALRSTHMKRAQTAVFYPPSNPIQLVYINFQCIQFTQPCSRCLALVLCVKIKSIFMCVLFYLLWWSARSAARHCRLCAARTRSYEKETLFSSLHYNFGWCIHRNCSNFLY